MQYTKNNPFRVRMCHANHELIVQFVSKSKHLSFSQRQRLLLSVIV